MAMRVRPVSDASSGRRVDTGPLRDGPADGLDPRRSMA